MRFEKGGRVRRATGAEVVVIGILWDGMVWVRDEWTADAEQLTVLDLNLIVAYAAGADSFLVRDAGARMAGVFREFLVPDE